MDVKVIILGGELDPSMEGYSDRSYAEISVVQVRKGKPAEFGLWQQGPEFPAKVVLTKLVVSHEKGSFYLVGGNIGFVGQESDKIYELVWLHGKNEPNTTWVELPQRLSQPRKRHVPMLIPDKYMEFCDP